MRYYYFIFFALFKIFLPFESHAMGIHPLGYHTTNEPHTTEQFQFTVTNTTDEMHLFRFSIRDGISPEQTSDIASWFRVPEPFLLLPDAQEVVVLEATIPSTAVPGDRYVYVMVEQLTETGQVAVQSEIGVPVTITVAGEIWETVNITALVLTHERGQMRGTMDFLNTGMVEVPVQGVLTLSTNNGVVATVPIEQRVRAGAVQSVSVEQILSPWYVGSVTMRAEMAYGVLQERITDTERIYVIGTNVWRLGAVGSIGIILGGVLFVRNKKQYVSSS